jgi:Mg2+/Co2+ transporter CorB
VIDASPLVIAGLVALLCASALFSGSETALFSLDEKERVRAGPRVERLLSDPRSLLITLLLCNLLINVAYFAFAAQLSPEGELAGVAVGFGVLLAVLVAGEIVPKSIALRSPLACARLAAWPVSAIVLVFTPVRRVCGFLIELVVRALGGPRPRHRRATRRTSRCGTRPQGCWTRGSFGREQIAAPPV